MLLSVEKSNRLLQAKQPLQGSEKVIDCSTLLCVTQRASRLPT